MRLKLCPLAELGDGEVREFEVGETEGIVIRSGDDIFAIQRYCSHEMFPLEFGLLQDDNTLRCTFHGAVFDLASIDCTKQACNSHPWYLLFFSFSQSPQSHASHHDSNFRHQSCGMQMTLTSLST